MSHFLVPYKLGKAIIETQKRKILILYAFALLAIAHSRVAQTKLFQF